MARTYEHRETLLDIQGVSRSYGETVVLKDCTATIRNIVRTGVEATTGQVVGLLGPSGVGKSTLFRIVAGLEEPDTGRVLHGSSGAPVETGSVGVVTQNYILFNHRRVLDNLTIAGKMAGMSRADATARAMELLERFGLGAQKNKYPAQLSGGQRQRVAIAQQLLCNPGMLLMDEPFSGLDVVALENCEKLVVEVANMAEENSIIVVTHDIGAAIATCDTLWLIGRDYAADGTPIPGARIMEEIDLIGPGLCWDDNIRQHPNFNEMHRYIRERFHHL